MIQPHKSECPGGAGQTANKKTEALDLLTFANVSKPLSSLFGGLFMLGYEVYALLDDGYLVTHRGTSFRCETLKDVYSLAQKVGAG